MNNGCDSTMEYKFNNCKHIVRNRFWEMAQRYSLSSCLFRHELYEGHAKRRFDKINPNRHADADVFEARANKSEHATATSFELDGAHYLGLRVDYRVMLLSKGVN